jgi:hypothetical protein
MSTPADPEAVLEAFQETQDDGVTESESDGGRDPAVG